MYAAHCERYIKGCPLRNNEELLWLDRSLLKGLFWLVESVLMYVFKLD